MFKETGSDWNAVRAQLEWPSKNRYIEAGFSDEDLGYYISRAIQEISALEEFGILSDDPKLDRVNELIRRIELGSNLSRPRVPHTMYAEMMGGKLNKDEELFVETKISELETELQSVVDAMVNHAGKQLGRRLDGLEVAEHNEVREKKEHAERERETRVAQIMTNKNLNHEDAIAELERQPFAEIDLERARELGLERVEVKAFPEAQRLLERVFDQTREDKFDVTHSRNGAAEIERFAAEWTLQLGTTVPMPCVIEKRYTSYLQRLAQGNIMKSWDLNNKQIARPRFDRPDVLFVEDWQDHDQYADNNSLVNTSSPLLRALGIKNKYGELATCVVEISREAVDEALWIGDPSNKIKTAKHHDLIVELGLDPSYYNFRLMAQDELARLNAAGKNFGKRNLWTHLNDYWVDGTVAHGLIGGYHFYGGPSNVETDHRGHADTHLAARLILECNK